VHWFFVAVSIGGREQGGSGRVFPNPFSGVSHHACAKACNES
jgi:hypothetical protein